MALLDLCLMPGGLNSKEREPELSEGSDAPLSAGAHDADRSSPAASTLGLKRRKAMFADVLPQAGDSYHWLKYGEKLLRDRRTLRHYYRCGSRAETGCSAKKMVDVLVTTGACHWHYRDEHNHPAPVQGAGGAPGQGGASRKASGAAASVRASPVHGGVSPLAAQSALQALAGAQMSSPAATAALAAALLAVQHADSSNTTGVLSGDGRANSPSSNGAAAFLLLNGRGSPQRHIASATVAAYSGTPQSQPGLLPAGSGQTSHTSSPLVQRHQDQFAASLAACMSFLSGSDSPQVSAFSGAPASNRILPQSPLGPIKPAHAAGPSPLGRGGDRLNVGPTGSQLAAAVGPAMHAQPALEQLLLIQRAAAAAVMAAAADGVASAGSEGSFGVKREAKELSPANHRRKALSPMQAQMMSAAGQHAVAQSLLARSSPLLRGSKVPEPIVAPETSRESAPVLKRGASAVAKERVERPEGQSRAEELLSPGGLSTRLSNAQSNRNGEAKPKGSPVSTGSESEGSSSVDRMERHEHASKKARREEPKLSGLSCQHCSWLSLGMGGSSCTCFSRQKM